MPTFYRKKSIDAVQELDSIHYVAEQFLREYNASEANTFVTESTRFVKPAPPDVQYIITRNQVPMYFAGTKPSGNVAWAYDKRFAKLLTKRESELWMESLLRDLFDVKTEVAK
jgi:hypothetical protein